MNRERESGDTKHKGIYFIRATMVPTAIACCGGSPIFVKRNIGDVEITHDVLWTSESPILEIQNIRDDDVYSRRAVRM